MTQSAPSNKSPPVSFRQRSIRGSMSMTRDICFRVRSMHLTFEVPTSASTAVACRFNDERVTWSKSTRRSFLTPLYAGQNDNNKSTREYVRPRQHDGCPASNSPASYDDDSALLDACHALVTEERVVSSELLPHELLVIL